MMPAIDYMAMPNVKTPIPWHVLSYEQRNHGVDDMSVGGDCNAESITGTEDIVASLDDQECIVSDINANQSGECDKINISLLKMQNSCHERKSKRLWHTPQLVSDNAGINETKSSKTRRHRGFIDKLVDKLLAEKQAILKNDTNNNIDQDFRVDVNSTRKEDMGTVSHIELAPLKRTLMLTSSSNNGGYLPRVVQQEEGLYDGDDPNDRDGGKADDDNNAGEVHV